MVFADFMGWPPLRGTGRTIEVPSIEPTADGYVVFTTNSAQQFESMLVMIGRGDLLEDSDLARAMSRFKRRAEFLAAVHEYTTKRSSEELLAEAGDLRIPAGPVLNGETIPTFEQFLARRVFVPSPSGRFRQPRVPYRIGDSEPRRGPTRAPSTGRSARRRLLAGTGSSRSPASESSTARPGGPAPPRPTPWPAWAPT